MDAELGAFVSAGAELMEVSNPRLVQIEAAVSAADANRIRAGDRAVIELPGGATLAATVRSSTPAVNLESRAATVVLIPEGVPAGLVQGQSVRARITPQGSDGAGRIVVSEAEVQSVEGRDVGDPAAASHRRRTGRGRFHRRLREAVRRPARPKPPGRIWHLVF